MRDAIRPSLHVFVCANRREGSPLGPGCSERGEAVYEALKREVAARGITRETWITKTFCLGICPQTGATVARYPARAGHGSIEIEVAPQDIPSLLEASSSDASGSSGASISAVSFASGSSGPESNIGGLARTVDDLEELQRKKVLDLARRLKPGLTMEDVQNPHDVPELDDPDWQYADGVLAGIASVKSALAALASERAHPSNPGADLDAETLEAHGEPRPRNDVR